MKLPRRQFLHLSAGAAAVPAASRIAWAQAYPSRPVRIVVGYAPGGAGDISMRLMGQWLSERLGQQFIIENRTGAGTNIATEAVVRATADGYTLLMSSAANAMWGHRCWSLWCGGTTMRRKRSKRPWNNCARSFGPDKH